MSDNAKKGDLLFEVMTPLGFRVRINRSYWKWIVTVKHPAMMNRELNVKEVLEKPNEIRLSQSDKKVYLFYALESKGRWVCV
jgi:hypothetical protein